MQQSQLLNVDALSVAKYDARSAKVITWFVASTAEEPDATRTTSGANSQVRHAKMTSRFDLQGELLFVDEERYFFMNFKCPTCNRYAILFRKNQMFTIRCNEVTCLTSTPELRSKREAMNHWKMMCLMTR
jgi:ribosomal protein S27E